ncbi:MAG: NAD(P)-dependent oxidoreductase [Planctomycetes bacterium]|nr:NAD(P)-dependent oxidoreductase [Planctomycetota bacterium]
MRVLITGGAGYIGSVLTPMLLNEGHEVTVLDSFLYQQKSLLDCCHHEKLRIIKGDARDEALVKRLMAGADAILPLACLTGAPICTRDPWAARAVNLDAIKTIVAHLSSSQHLVFPSTNSGYGIGQPGIYCNEDTPLRPVSLYGRLKVEAEAFLLDRGNCVTFRFATLFGGSPRMRLDLLVNDFTYRAVTDRYLVLFEPHFKRNYLHVRDAARAFVHVLGRYERMKGKPYNVGLSDANLSKWELAEAIKQCVPELQFISADVGEDQDKRNYIVSNARIEATGFEAKHNLQAGIRELIKVYQVVRRNECSNA